jgi:hypothetical protein
MALPVVWLLHTTSARSQADTAFVASSVAAAHGRYEATVLEQSTLLVGSAYRETEYTRDQHPFFLADTLQPATILYNGQEYSGVPMLYDLAEDRVIIQNPFLGELMMLIDEKVQGFVIQNRVFRKQDGYQGYYEVLQEGNITALGRRSKSFNKTTIGNEREIRYSERSRYYVAYDDKLSPVSSQASLLRLMSAQKNSMKKFIQDLGLDFEQNFEESMIVCVAYYNSLTAQP